MEEVPIQTKWKVRNWLAKAMEEVERAREHVEEQVAEPEGTLNQGGAGRVPLAANYPLLVCTQYEGYLNFS